MSKNKGISLTNEQFMMLCNGSGIKYGNKPNLAEEWNKVVEDNENFHALTLQVKSWLDEEYAQRLSEMTRNYEAEINSQDKQIRKLRNKVASMELQVQMLEKSNKKQTHVVQNHQEQIRDLLDLKGEMKAFRKEYKKLEDHVKSISKLLRAFAYVSKIVAPGDSFKVMTKKFKRKADEDFYYYRSSTSKRIRIPDILESNIVDVNVD